MSRSVAVSAQFIAKFNSNSEINYFLIGVNLFSYLQSINRTLSKLYLAHQCILANRSKSFQHQNQYETDYNVYKNSLIVEEYRHALCEFISSLRVAIDQLLLLLAYSFGEDKKFEVLKNNIY